MNKIKVLVKLFTQEQFFGNLYVTDDERIQDLMNDDRRFIPFEKTHMERGPKNQVTSSIVVINKEAIASIEELL